MTLTMPVWGWATVAMAIMFAVLAAYGNGSAAGWDSGVDHMKREAIRAGLAKACDFDGGWRWWTRDEIINKKHN